MNLIIGRNGLIASELIRRGGYTFTTSMINEEGFFLDLYAPESFDYQQINSETKVIFLAAISSPDKCENDFENAYSVNVTGTKYFIEKVLENGGKVLFFSSDVIYGNTTDPVNEDAPTHPFGEYAKMKDEVEKAFAGKDNFKVFRLSYVLSQGDKYLQYLQNCLKESKTAEVFHPFYRKIVFMEDVLDAIEAILQKWDAFPNQKFNICGNENVSRKDIADYFNEAVGNNLKYVLIEPDENFWMARPKNIELVSLYLEQLLGRKPIKIREAVHNIVKGKKIA
ncbi:NAD-dependent epimerase/dehydratase family protein [Sulfurimonas diazotrophicus]|uniref:Sugar nucleotide-binding protein n=1 Tax=Sulfurimonas diazotrophicus TaxID=3131939 RepID=A0ABZ3H8F7_9BACT